MLRPLITLLMLIPAGLLAQTWEKVYKGKVGPRQVSMSLAAKDGNLSGTYSYDSDSEPVQVHGFIVGKSIEIDGYDARGNKIEKFIGQISRFDIHGVWIGEELRNRHAFSLKEELVLTPEIKPGKRIAYIAAVAAVLALAGILYFRNWRKKNPGKRFSIRTAAKKLKSWSGRAENEYEFEKYITEKLNPDLYRLVEWRSKKLSGDSHDHSPELLFERKNPPHIKSAFTIRCRFAGQPADLTKGGSEKRLAGLKNDSEASDIPLFIAIGLGGKPSRPEQLFVVPADKIKGDTIRLSDISEFRITGSRLNYDPYNKTLK